MKAHKKMAFLLIFLLLHTSCSTGEIIVLRPAEPSESECFSEEEKTILETSLEEETVEIPILLEPEETEIFVEEESPEIILTLSETEENDEEVSSEEISPETSSEESTEVIPPEQIPPENLLEDIESDENYKYLQSIIADKPFEESMKNVIMDSFRQIYQTYDKIYAYKKLSKEKYLKMFCDIVKDRLGVAELVEEQDKEEAAAKLLEKKGAIGITKNDTIYLGVDDIGRVTANMAHEVWHLENQDLKVLIADNGIDIGVGTREGLSAWQEGFVEPFKNSEVMICNVGINNIIKMNKDIIQRGTEDYTAVYPGYKNNTERLITLLGMETYMKIVHSEHDYITSLREELCKEFERDMVDEFLANYIISTCFLSKKGIQVMDRINDRCDSIRLNIAENEKLLLCNTEEEFYAEWEEKIREEEQQISNYQSIIEQYQNADEYAISTIDILESAIFTLKNTIHVRKDLTENYTYEFMVDIIKFDIEMDKAKLRAFENYQEIGEWAVWDIVIDLEKSFNVLMVDRINHARNLEEFNELTESCDNYNRGIRIRCYEGGQDVTADNFEKTVGRAIKNRPAFQPTDAQ